MSNGYRHPVMGAALTQQIETFSHVVFGGLTHDPALELAQRLVGDETSGWQPAIDRIFRVLETGLPPASDLPTVNEARVTGGIGDELGILR